MIKDISVIIPLHNESKNIMILYDKLKKELERLSRDYEIIFVDDGSDDDTFRILTDIYEKDTSVNIISFDRNYGQTAGLAAGFKFAKGNIIITMDGDLQHDPEDIHKFIDKIQDGYDMVGGWKVKRSDNFFTRRLPSLIVNRVISFLFKVKMHEVSSTYKAYKKDVVKNIFLYGGLHRFIPLLIESNCSVCEVEIRHNKRLYGKSHYNIGRVGSVIHDLVMLLWARGDKSSKPKKLVYSIKDMKYHK
ncbi:MAG: glycosyltransferase family 2 protein [Candidatus Omnitrophica bacterium]|nr:glycosyltransferase family 2 protein [Candidatus Omnitrophota bacterium]